MKRFIIFISLASILLCNLVLAQVPHPENYRVIYGNRDGTPMSVQLGQIIHFPVWGATDPTDSIDTVATMFNPLKSPDVIVPERLGGHCSLCDDDTSDPGPPPYLCYIADPYHSHDSTSQGLLFIGELSDPHSCFFITFGDTVLTGYFTMSLTNDSSYLGRTICPFGEGHDSAHGGALWGFADGLTQVIPVATYGCLYFSPCNAVPGDANGDSVFNAVDLVYSVNYFKGSGNPPASWDCPGHGSVFVGGDANGNCVFNAIDITYCVNYLKGHGTAPRRCPSC